MSETEITFGLYLSAPYPCSYLPEQQARSQVVVPSHLVNTTIYAQLIQQNFRRSGEQVYRPRCDNCQACISVRLRTTEFVANKTQRRLYKRHQQELTAKLIHSPSYSNEHFELYKHYQQTRHPETYEPTNKADYENFLIRSYVDTRFIEFRSSDNVLRMVCIFDYLTDGLSAVYTFYDTEYQGSLGTYAILYLSQLCQQWQLPYLYLGYWVKNSPKMNYKNKFAPLEYNWHGQWLSKQPNMANSL
ncbi:arginyltransferase [Pelistega sp. MC2]|uniref:arginyltransferase n=1 Tax=Pelistega sp. MC2 TaxID=1720297 RepID=UPI0008D9489A|nr:arginyltransferase [Pelistega sp. MC2]